MSFVLKPITALHIEQSGLIVEFLTGLVWPVSYNWLGYPVTSSPNHFATNEIATKKYLTIIPLARMGSDSIAHEAIDSEAMSTQH